MPDLSKFQEIISEEIINTSANKFPKELYEPIDYTLSNGGKRLRPLLTLIACDIFNGKIEDAIYPALGIEIFHNFTLVHDDIMDKSPVRRGKPTVYKNWDSNIAILSGDTMFVLAYEYVVNTKPEYLKEILTVFNNTSREVCEGQQYDMNFEKQSDVAISDYLLMIKLKTAVLIAASLKIGAVIAGASEEDKENIYTFGEKIGIAFQLKDDYLDTFGDLEKFGKKIGNDIITNKKTYLYLKAYEDADKNQKARLDRAFDLDNSDKKIEEVISIYKELNIDKKTETEISKYFNDALSHLNSLKITDENKKFIINFSNKLVDREN